MGVFSICSQLPAPHTQLSTHTLQPMCNTPHYVSLIAKSLHAHSISTLSTLSLSKPHLHFNVSVYFLSK